MLLQLAQVACEIEGTEGTAETLEAADVFLVSNPHFEPIIEPYERNPVSGDLSPHPSVFGRRSARLTFDVELVGTAVAGDPIHFSDALQACGVYENDLGVTIAYTPLSTGIPSVTIALYMDGKSYTMWGARGTCKLLLEVGKPGILSFEFIGAGFTETDESLLEGATYNAIIPPTFQGAALTINDGGGAYAALVSKVEINLGNILILRPDVNKASGHISAVITDRKTTFSFDPENVLTSVEDFLGNWRSGTQIAFITTLTGAAAGNIITITAPKVQYQDVKMADRSGLSNFEISGILALSSGDDEWNITIA